MFFESTLSSLMIIAWLEIIYLKKNEKNTSILF